MFERGKLTVVIGDSGAGKEYVVECYEKNRINVFINYENPPKNHLQLLLIYICISIYLVDKYFQMLLGKSIFQIIKAC